MISHTLSKDSNERECLKASLIAIISNKKCAAFTVIKHRHRTGVVVRARCNKLKRIAVRISCAFIINMLPDMQCYSADGFVLQSHYAVMVQLAPILFLLLISLITAFLASEPTYSLRMTQ